MIRDQLNALAGLQEVDLKIDRLNQKKAAFPVQLKTIDDELTRLRKLAAGKGLAIAEIEKLERQHRGEVELSTDQLSRSRARLEGVQNTHEHQSVSREIEKTEKLLAALTGQLAQGAQDMAVHRKELAEIDTQITHQTSSRSEQAKSFGGQTEVLDRDLAKLQLERTPFLAQVPPRILAQYDRIRGARGGMGISLALAGRCQACNMVIPPQMFNEINRGTSLHQCPSCFRVLYSKGE
jgi:predicted  nucleic acid-binding Zn-ribbon protein